MNADDRKEHSRQTTPDAVEPAGGDRRTWLTFAGGVALVLAAAWVLGARGLLDFTDGQSPSPTDTAVVNEAHFEDVKQVTDLAELPPGPAEHVEVAYFHRTHRCWSCTEAERLTRVALEDGFADDLATGRLTLVVADVEQAENAGLAARYEAWGSSLYLGISKAGATYVHPVSDIWYAIGDESVFVPSLQEKIAMALGK